MFQEQNPLAEQDHDKLFPAKELYTGDDFQNSLKFDLEKFGCNDYYILSGKYGLLEKDKKIKFYDYDLTAQKKSVKEEWADKVYSQLQKKFPNNLGESEFVFFAPLAYAKGLTQRLKCITLKYVGRRIKFEEKGRFNFD